MREIKMRQRKRRQQQQQGEEEEGGGGGDGGGGGMWKRWKFMFSLRALREKVAPSSKKKINSSEAKGNRRSSSRCPHEARQVSPLVDSSSSAAACTSSSSMLDHSAARHRIAVRPPRQRSRTRNRRRGNNNNNNKQECRQQREVGNRNGEPSSSNNVNNGKAGGGRRKSNSGNVHKRRRNNDDNGDGDGDGGGRKKNRATDKKESVLSEEERALLDRLNKDRDDGVYGGSLVLNRSRSLAIRRDGDLAAATAASSNAGVVRRHSIGAEERSAGFDRFERISRQGEEEDEVEGQLPSLVSTALSKREEGDGDSGGGSASDAALPSSPSSPVEFRSSLNANVIFRRASPSVPAAGGNKKSSSRSRTVRSESAALSGRYRGRERFLTSVEHWTLANEGLRKSICDLSGVSKVLVASGDCRQWWPGLGLMSERAWGVGGQDGDGDYDSLDSICSSAFGMEVSRLLEDLSETAAQIVAMSKEEDKEEDEKVLTKSSSSGLGSSKEESEAEEEEETRSDDAKSGTDVSDTQCDAGGEEMEEVAERHNGRSLEGEEEKQAAAAASTAVAVVDELENVNVREMRKIFLLPAAATATAVAAAATAAGACATSTARKRKSKSCANLYSRPPPPPPPQQHPTITRRAAAVMMSGAKAVAEESALSPPRRKKEVAATNGDGSFVRALVLKFNQISTQPTSL